MSSETAPGLAEFLERSPTRLLLEAALGAAGGALLSTVLPGGEGRAAVFALAGGVTAPLALLLTPVAGSVVRRALRYGAALAVLLTLILSFAASDGILLEELLGFALLIFGIGAVGHGVLIGVGRPSRDGKNLPPEQDDPSGVDSGKGDA